MLENDDIETVPPAPVETGIAAVAPAQTGVLFSVTEATIKELAVLADFQVTDIHDKGQVKQLHSNLLKVVRARRSVDATRKVMNEPYQEIIKQNNALGKKLAETIAPLEMALEKEEERVEKAIEAERVAAANALFKKRSEALEAIGMTMPENLIRTSSDENFEEHMMMLRAQAAERDRLEQQRKDQEAAAASLKAEQDAEAARLKSEQEERERIERDRQEAARLEADRLRQEEAERLRLEREDLDRQKEELRKQQAADAEELRLAREELDRLREDARKEREDRERQQREAEEAAAKAAEQPAPVQSASDSIDDPANAERVGEIIDFLNKPDELVPVIGQDVWPASSPMTSFLGASDAAPAMIPVAIDDGSTVKPVAELSYAPSDGWENNCIPSTGDGDPADTPEVLAELADATEKWLNFNNVRMSDVRSVPFPVGMVKGLIGLTAIQCEEIQQLRKIMSCVPGKTLIKAKEKAGYGTEVTAADAV